MSNDAASVDSSSPGCHGAMRPTARAGGTVRRILQSDSGSASEGRRALADLDGDSDASSVASARSPVRSAKRLGAVRGWRWKVRGASWQPR